MYLERSEVFEMGRERVVIILSGGMDSCTLAYELKSQGYEVFALSFNYNQKHKKELSCAKKICKKLDIFHKILDLSVLNEVAPSALTRDGWKVPEGHYEDKNMKQTVVPNRNLVMANLALAYALSTNATKIYMGLHAGDHFVYEDCREQALIAMNESAYIWSSDNRGTLTPSWIASFFEAEGCFSHNNYRQIMYHRKTGIRLGVANMKVIPTVIISQNDKNLLEEIKKFFYNRGSIYKQNKTNCYNYVLQWQDCRLMINLMNIYGFKTVYKKEQFNKWYIRFKDMFEREVECDNPKIKGKIYNIQKIVFEAPYLYINKIDIANKGKQLGVDYSLSWTCYKGGEKACGKCGSCVERLEAFKKAEMKDPIEYEGDVNEI
jgi:queuosine biosynthesis protein QueC